MITTSSTLVSMMKGIHSQDTYNKIVEEWCSRGEDYSTNSPLKRLRLMRGGRYCSYRYHSEGVENLFFFSIKDGITVDLYQPLPEVFAVEYSGRLADLKDLTMSGIKDITNIKPHEYGILKLKYGIDKEDMFIPKVFHPLIHEIYKGLDL